MITTAAILPPSLARWIPRVVGSVVAGTVWFLLFGLEPAAPFAFEIALASSTDGTLQLFYDRGAGLREVDSATTAIRASSQPVKYRLSLPAGKYRVFRIDPNDRAGEYSISALRVVRANGDAVVDVPLNELRASSQATLSVSGNTATVHVPGGATDPQLVYEPSGGVRLAPSVAQRAAPVVPVLPAAAVGLLIAWLLERVPVGWTGAEIYQAVCRSPSRAIVILGMVAATLSTYPLFFGRSLVSPNNGGTFLFYDEPPFTYGSTDFAVEDVRGTDPGSMMWAILPYTELQRDALAAGKVPLWNRYNAIGRPLWGQGQHFFLEPLHFAALVVSNAAYRADAVFITARGVFAGGAGLATLVATGSTPAAAIIAAASPFIGYFWFRFNHPAYFSIVYAPWLLWAYFRLGAARSRSELARRTAVLALFSALQMVGSTPKEGVIVWAIAHLVGFVSLLLVVGSAADRRRRLAAAVVAGLLGVIVTAPDWLIFLDTLSRAHTAYDTPTANFAGWNQIPAAISLGALLPGRPFPSLNGVLAVMALTALSAPVMLWRRRAALACAVGGAAALSLAGGAVPASVILKLPLLANVHQLWNVLLTAALAPLLVLAGAGIALVHERPLRGIAGAAVATLALALTAGAGLPPFYPGSLTLALASLGPALAVALLFACVSSSRSAAVPVLLVAVLGAGLLPGGLQFETRNQRLNEVLLQPRPRVRLDLAPPPIEAARARADGDPFRVASLDNVLFAGTQGYYKLEGLTGPDALEVPQEVELLDAAGIARSLWRPVFRQQDLNGARGLLDMLGVRFVFARAYHLPAHIPRVPLREPDPVNVVERPSAWPRAFFVDGVRRHSDVARFVRELQASSAPFASIEADDEQAIGLAGDLPAIETRYVAAHDYDLAPNRTSFVIEAPRSGAVVLAEAFVPLDFVATLNGQRVDYFRVNHALKGIRVPAAGSWTVAFEYRPRRWLLSWALSVIGASAIAALAVVGRRS